MGSLLVVVLLVFQIGMIGIANNLANSAARQAAERAAVIDGDAGTAQAHGQDFVSSGIWEGTPTVSVSRGDEQTVVTVTGTVVQIIGTPWDSIAVEVAIPTERFVPLDGG